VAGRLAAAGRGAGRLQRLDLLLRQFDPGLRPGVHPGVLCFAVFWRLVERPSCAALRLLVMALLSIHCNYQNSYLPAGVGLGRPMSCAACGQWKRSILVLGLCGVAALSMLVYLPTIGAYRVAASIMFRTMSMKEIGDTVERSIAWESVALLRIWILSLLLVAAFCRSGVAINGGLGWGDVCLRCRSIAWRPRPSAAAPGWDSCGSNSLLPWPWHFTPRRLGGG